MKEKTPEQKHKNVLYQLRHRKRRKLELAATELLRLINTNWPIDTDYSLIRRITMRVGQALRLPYRWTDADLARAYKALDKLKKELYSEEPESFTHEYHALLTYMMDAFQHAGGTTEERLMVAMEIMRMVGTEVNGEYGDKKPNVSDAMFFAMASGMTPYPQWVKDDLARFVVNNFSEEERKEFCEKISQSARL